MKRDTRCSQCRSLDFPCGDRCAAVTYVSSAQMDEMLGVTVPRDTFERDFAITWYFWLTVMALTPGLALAGVGALIVWVVRR